MNAADTYQKACARCHGRNGSGTAQIEDADLRPRDFTNLEWQASVTDEAIAQTVRQGRGPMPAFGSVLSEPEIAAAVMSVRSFGR